MNRRGFIKFLNLSSIAAVLSGCRQDPRIDAPAPLQGIPAGASVVFGVAPEKPIRTCLPGRIRVRLRNTDFAQAFVRHNGSTRHFILFEVGDHWELGLEQGGNVTDPLAINPQPSTLNFPQ